jgi:hypothetical protein
MAHPAGAACCHIAQGRHAHHVRNLISHCINNAVSCNNASTGTMAANKANGVTTTLTQGIAIAFASGATREI